MGQRLPSVLQTLYLIFNEGYTATSGAVLQRRDLAGEAVRLTRTVHRLLPGDCEVAGLLALMLLTDARRDARSGPHGELIPLDEQDRDRWDKAAIEEGVALVTEALARGRPGPYQLRAAIAAVHDEAPSPEATDWPEILGLYDVLLTLVPGPVERLNRAVAVAMVHGPHAGLSELDVLADELKGHRLDAVRGHLLERAGEARSRSCRLRVGRRADPQPARAALSPGPGGAVARLACEAWTWRGSDGAGCGAGW
ncbi:hypothetical protein SVIOM74S_09621 [Streptomyces violarus]